VDGEEGQNAASVGSLEQGAPAQAIREWVVSEAD